MGSRTLQLVQPIQLAQFADGKFSLKGRLAHVVVLHTPITPDQLAYAYQVQRLHVTAQGLSWGGPARRLFRVSPLGPLGEWRCVTVSTPRHACARCGR